MELKHADLTVNIDKKTPFSNCKLGREPIANALTNVVASYPKGFVLAINNEWGTGKTTFVKMWQQHLENNDYKTIYFNAWENDFDQNPLVAIISELKELSDSSSKKLFDAILPKAAAIAKNLLPAIVKTALKQYGIVDVLEEVTKEAAEVFEKEVDEYKAKKQTITEFRKDLEAFVSETQGDKPLVFFIDELDRCRPDYAVELLEQIKHLFSVEGIVFVLSIDKAQLGHAVRGFYGNDRIDAEEYLRRFIDLEYSMPSPSVEKFVNYLYGYYSFDDVFASKERSRHGEFYSDRDIFLSVSKLLLNGMTLRKQEKIFGFTRLIVSSFANNVFIFPDLLLVLIYIKMMKPELYARISTKNIDIQELVNEFESIVLKGSTDEASQHSLLFTEARLLHFYNNRWQSTRKRLFEVDRQTGAKTTAIQTKLKSNHLDMADALFALASDFHTNDCGLSYLLDRIDLLALNSRQ